MDPKPDEQHQARSLYMGSNLTQQQIADLLKVDRRTIGRWISEGSWKEAKYAAVHSPSILVSQYYHQLGALNTSIAMRRENPWPTKDEAETIRRITMTIDRLKPKGTLVQTIETFARFLDTMRQEGDTDTLKKITLLLDKHVRKLSQKGNALPFADFREQEQADKEFEDGLAAQLYAAPPSADVPTPASTQPLTPPPPAEPEKKPADTPKPPAGNGTQMGQPPKQIPLKANRLFKNKPHKKRKKGH